MRIISWQFAVPRNDSAVLWCPMGGIDEKWRIGIDFDNTIVRYDRVFLAAARESQLVGERFTGDKRAIRDAVRLLPDGELKWQRLQAYVYGSGISNAVMFDGLDRFLRRCRAEGHTVIIVSHKTEYGHFDASQIKLRNAARCWMTAQGLFREDLYGIFSDHVFFESTRAEKLQRIADLACTYFIDDLEEVLNDTSFPSTVTRILFGTKVASGDLPYIVCPTWRHVEEVVFSEHT